MFKSYQRFDTVDRAVRPAVQISSTGYLLYGYHVRTGPSNSILEPDDSDPSPNWERLTLSTFSIWLRAADAVDANIYGVSSIIPINGSETEFAVVASTASELEEGSRSSSTTL